MYSIFLPSIVVPKNSEDFSKVDNRNKAYEQLKASKVGSDKFNQDWTQTAVVYSKPKEIIPLRKDDCSFGVSATRSEIEDYLKTSNLSAAIKRKNEFHNEVEKIIKKKTRKKGLFFNTDGEIQQALVYSESDKTMSQSKDIKKTSNITQSRSNMVSTSNAPESSMNDTQKSTSKEVQGEGEGGMFEEEEEDREELVLSMKGAFKIIERLVTESKYHKMQVHYKAYPIMKFKVNEESKNKGQPQIFQKVEESKTEDDDMTPENLINKVMVKKLFTYSCNDTKGRNVSGLDWNKANPDLLAATYGEFESIKDSKPGLLCLWTLKNPEYPERIYEHPVRLTCCNFSKSNPYLIAVGGYDGNISIYDLRSEDKKPILSSSNATGKHSDAVYEVQWINKEGKGESLISIGGDGRVVEWSMKKGLDFSNLIQLKKYSNPKKKKEANEGIIFTDTIGYSFDFPYDDKTVYYASTEDGAIHKCSISYSDQPTETFFDHKGPVYKVRCNPYCNNIFLSCSYDWTMRLWNTKNIENNNIPFYPNELYSEITDIEWYPHTSTIFGDVTQDGRLEIWDFLKQQAKPIVKYPEIDAPNAIPRTTLKFSPFSPVLASGKSNGEIEIFRIGGLTHVQVSLQDQQNHMEEALKLLGKSTKKEGDKI